MVAGGTLVSEPQASDGSHTLQSLELGGVAVLPLWDQSPERFWLMYLAGWSQVSFSGSLSKSVRHVSFLMYKSSLLKSATSDSVAGN